MCATSNSRIPCPNCQYAYQGYATKHYPLVREEAIASDLPMSVLSIKPAFDRYPAGSLRSKMVKCSDSLTLQTSEYSCRLRMCPIYHKDTYKTELRTSLRLFGNNFTGSGSWNAHLGPDEKRSIGEVISGQPLRRSLR